jgi:hypothetical protein
MYEEFEYFMKFNGYWEKFKKNIIMSDYQINKCYLPIEKYIYHVIEDSFIFSRTKEGFDYWREINNDWKAFMNYWKEDFDVIYYGR